MATTHEQFKQWCKETNRSGGVLVGSSIKEFCDWLDKNSRPKYNSNELKKALDLHEKSEFTTASSTNTFTMNNHSDTPDSVLSLSHQLELWKNAYTEQGSLLLKAMEALDDYLNAGWKEKRRDAAHKAKIVYKEFFGIEYKNRMDRDK